MQMSYVHSARKIYAALRNHCWPLLSRWNLDSFVKK